MFQSMEFLFCPLNEPEELDKVVITNDADVRAPISSADKQAFIMPISARPPGTGARTDAYIYKL